MGNFFVVLDARSLVDVSSCTVRPMAREQTAGLQEGGVARLFLQMPRWDSTGSIIPCATGVRPMATLCRRFPAKCLAGRLVAPFYESFCS